MFTFFPGDGRSRSIRGEHGTLRGPGPAALFGVRRATLAGASSPRTTSICRPPRGLTRSTRWPQLRSSVGEPQSRPLNTCDHTQSFARPVLGAVSGAAQGRGIRGRCPVEIRPDWRLARQLREARRGSGRDADAGWACRLAADPFAEEVCGADLDSDRRRHPSAQLLASARASAEPHAGVRISTARRGRADTSVEVTLANEPGATDQTIDEAGATIFVDETAAEFLDDKVLDASVEGEGRALHHPQPPIARSGRDRPADLTGVVRARCPGRYGGRPLFCASRVQRDALRWPIKHWPACRLVACMKPLGLALGSIACGARPRSTNHPPDSGVV